MARASPASERDHRSLARQLAEDAEIIEINEDHGVGVSKFLSSSDSDNYPGFSVNQETRKEGNRGPGLLACDFLGTPVISSHKKSPEGEEEEEMEDEGQKAEPDPVTPLVTSARTVTSGARIRFGNQINPFQWSTGKDVEELLVTMTPSTPDEQRQFDDEACPVTRGEIRK